MLYFLETLQVRAPSHGGVLYSFLYWWNVVSPAGAVGSGTGDIATPPVRPSVRLSVTFIFCTVTQRRSVEIFFLEKQFFLISRFMLFSTVKNKNNIEKCPFTYWLNGRWFFQIVDRDSGNLYIQYNLLFPCSDFWSQTYQMWGGWGGGGGNIFLAFMLFPFLEKINSGNKKQNICLFRKTIVDRDSGNLYPIYI